MIAAWARTGSSILAGGRGCPTGMGQLCRSLRTIFAFIRSVTVTVARDG